MKYLLNRITILCIATVGFVTFFRVPIGMLLSYHVKAPIFGPGDVLDNSWEIWKLAAFPSVVFAIAGIILSLKLSSDANGEAKKIEAKLFTAIANSVICILMLIVSMHFFDFRFSSKYEIYGLVLAIFLVSIFIPAVPRKGKIT